jgi:hypothetical protein
MKFIIPNTLTGTDVLRDVEKLIFQLKVPKFRGYEMSRDSRRSLITHPEAKLFLRI